MNCSEANNMDLVELLTKHNYFPVKENKNEAWYFSPFRNENTASFRINKRTNRWWDYGEGSGKTAVDLMVKLKNFTVIETLDYLDNNSFSFHQQKVFKRIKKEKCVITSIQEIQNSALINYLHSRKIDISIAKKYCKEIHYFNINNFSSSDNQNLSQPTNSIRPYFTIGIKNDLGGYETRNEIYKRCLNVKAITTINNDSEVLNLFEGLLDCLSYLSLFPEKENEDFIITNSTSTIKKVIELLPNYKIVKSFFDNDTSGKRAAEIIKSHTENEFQDCSGMYKNYKDLNEFLMADKAIERSKSIKR